MDTEAPIMIWMKNNPILGVIHVSSLPFIFFFILSFRQIITEHATLTREDSFRKIKKSVLKQCAIYFSILTLIVIILYIKDNKLPISLMLLLGVVFAGLIIGEVSGFIFIHRHGKESRVAEYIGSDATLASSETSQWQTKLSKLGLIIALLSTGMVVITFLTLAIEGIPESSSLTHKLIGLGLGLLMVVSGLGVWKLREWGRVLMILYGALGIAWISLTQLFAPDEMKFHWYGATFSIAWFCLFFFGFARSNWLEPPEKKKDQE